MTFAQAREQVSLTDVKEVSDPDFIGYELGQIMTSGKLGSVAYLFKNGKVIVYDNSNGDFRFATDSAKQYERDGKVFLKMNEIGGVVRMVYYPDTETIYLAEMDLDVEEIIDVMITLI